MTRIIMLVFLLFLASGFSHEHNTRLQRTVTTPTYADTPPVWGSDDHTRIQNGGQRISERKCEEYSKSVVQFVELIELIPEATKMTAKIAKCRNGIELIVDTNGVRSREFPHLASIGWGKAVGDYSFKCGGTLISPRFVLTAGHCTRDPSAADPVPTVVRLGDQNVNPAVQDGARHVKVVPIKTIYCHPEYKPPIRYDDIALIELQNDVDIEADIRPACLWTKPDFDGHNKAISIGRKIWSDSSSEHQQVLQKTILSLLEKERCEQLLAPLWNRKWMGSRPTQMCAGVIDGAEDICQVDGGFPLQVQANDNQCIHYVMGVTSFGSRCTTARDPTVYTRVSSYLDWIEGIVWPEE